MRTSIGVKKPLPLLSARPSLTGVEYPERPADSGGAAVARAEGELWRRGEEGRRALSLSVPASA